jgi:predicted metal-dependent phosphotriesterase family hydrolase
MYNSWGYELVMPPFIEQLATRGFEQRRLFRQRFFDPLR